MNRILNNIIIIAILLILPCHMFAQKDKIVNVSFDIEGANSFFSEDLHLLFRFDGKEIQPILFLNGFIVPDFGNAEAVDVCFVLKKQTYCINNLPVSKFEGSWTFGIDKKPFKEENRPQEKGVNRIFFIRFTPANGGDGTQVVVTVKK